MWKLILFKELRIFVLKELYRLLFFGYLGVNKILEWVRIRFFLYGIRRDVGYMCRIYNYVYYEYD